MEKKLYEVLTCGTWDPEECDDRKWGGGTCDGCPYQKWVTMEELLKEEKMETQHYLIINEQHELLPDQKKQLEEKFPQVNFNIVKVPADGWTRQEMDKVMTDMWGGVIVFVSPIPYMLQSLAFYSGVIYGKEGETKMRTLIFHNPNRVKKELPNGKVISVLAEDGWELI